MEADINGVVVEFHRISPEHGYVNVPAITNPLNIISIGFIYQQITSKVILQIPVANTPSIYSPHVI